MRQVLAGRLRVRWQVVVDVALTAVAAALFAAGGPASVPLSVGQILPLAWRRRAPGAVLCVVGVFTAAHMAAGMTRALGYLPALVAMYTAATSEARLVRWGVCGVTAAAVAASTQRGLGEVVAIFAAAWMLGVERRRNVRERSAFAAESARLRLERRVVEEQLAAAEGRELLARRLHDTLARTITVMLVQTEALRSAARLTPADGERVDRVLGAGREALAEVRDAIRDLDALEVATAADDLTERLDQLRAAGLDVPAAPPQLVAELPAAVRAVAHRLVGEAATNALRYGGPGTRLDLAADRDGDGVTITATSHPPRHATRGAEGTGYGLRSLTADVETYGGTLAYGPREDGTWVVAATFPRVPLR
ncbi:sensor histidine kinase [Nonomuraea sp. NPDC003727]